LGKGFLGERQTDSLIPSGLPWVSTVGLFVLVGAKVISVSYGSPITAMTLVDAAGAISVVMGTLVSTFGSIVGLAFLVLAALGSRDLAPREQVVVRALTVGLWLILICFTWWAWFLLGLLALDRVFGSPGLLWVIRKRRKEDSKGIATPSPQDRMASMRKRADAGEDVDADLAAFQSDMEVIMEQNAKQDSMINRIDGVTFTLVAALTLVAFLWPTPWIPPEQIELTDGTAFVGYVISEEPRESSVVLKNDDRTVVTIPVSEIAKSALCTTSTGGLGGLWFSSLFEMFVPEAAYPPCDTEEGGARTGTYRS
jgi:hypothetical protein